MFVDFIILNILLIYFLERGEGRKKERERNINVKEKHQLVASHMHPRLGSEFTTHACALTGN